MKLYQVNRGYLLVSGVVFSSWKKTDDCWHELFLSSA